MIRLTFAMLNPRQMSRVVLSRHLFLVERWTSVAVDEPILSNRSAKYKFNSLALCAIEAGFLAFHNDLTRRKTDKMTNFNTFLVHLPVDIVNLIE